MATRRTRSDTAAGAIKAMFDAAKAELQPPVHVILTDTARKFWPGIIQARARDEWADVDLVVAAQLAQCQADMAEEDDALRYEGRVLQTQRGTPVMNPRTTVMEQLARREMALMRTLRMGGRVAGDARDELGKRKIQRQSQKLRKELKEDDLLAS